MGKVKRVMSEDYTGVFYVDGVKGRSYGIDYYNATTSERVRKILKGCKSEKEANKLRNIEMADASRGLLHRKYDLKGSTKVITLQKAVDLYSEWAEHNKKSFYVEKFKYPGLCSAFKGKLLSDITPLHIDRYKSDRAKQVSEKTTNKELIILRQIYAKCIEWKQYEGENPVLAVKGFKIAKDEKPGSLEPDQVAAIMKQITHSVEKDMVAFAYYTGFRNSEIRRLKWEDVNLPEGVVYIMDSKNGKNARIVIGEEVIDIIKRQPQKGKYVFCKHNGEPFKTCLNGVIKSAAEKAGVTLPPRKKWHLFRRTWATMMHQNGVDIATIQELGNWKDYTMPLWYGDSMRDDGKRNAANKIPKLKM